MTMCILTMLLSSRIWLLPWIDHSSQGITLYNSTAYFESGGLYGQSRIQLVNIEDGRVLNQYSIDKKYFGTNLIWFCSSS